MDSSVFSDQMLTVVRTHWIVDLCNSVFILFDSIYIWKLHEHCVLMVRTRASGISYNRRKFQRKYSETSIVCFDIFSLKFAAIAGNSANACAYHYWNIFLETLNYLTLTQDRTILRPRINNSLLLDVPFAAGEDTLTAVIQLDGRSTCVVWLKILIVNLLLTDHYNLLFKFHFSFVFYFSVDICWIVWNYLFLMIL